MGENKFDHLLVLFPYASSNKNGINHHSTIFQFTLLVPLCLQKNFTDYTTTTETWQVQTQCLRYESCLQSREDAMCETGTQRHNAAPSGTGPLG